MPFVDPTAEREILQQPAYAAPIDTDFGEVFTASLGKTFDEELSISGALNREGWQQRRRLLDEKIKAGEINRGDYLAPTGMFDYNRASVSLNDPAIKTDEALEEERKGVLDQRRQYANDVIERGSGMAQFLGAANAFMLDPISIATMPISTAATTAKSLSIAGRALLTARNTAAVEMAAELAIQPLVYQHKSDIEAPMNEYDAILNIATAGIGAGVIGGATGGLAGYFSKVRKAAESLPKTPELESALENIARMEESISFGRSKRFTPDDVLNDYDKFLQGEIDGAAKASEQTIKSLEKRTAQISKEADTFGKVIAKSGGIDTVDAIAQGVDPAAIRGGSPVFGKPLWKKGGRSADDLAEVINQIDTSKIRTANDVVNIIHDIANGTNDFIDPAIKAEINFNTRTIDDLSRAKDTAEIERIYKNVADTDLEADAEYLRQLEDQRFTSNAPSREPSMYEIPERSKAASSTIGRQNEVLDATGLTDDYNKAMDDFSKLDNPVVIDEAGDIIDAKAFVDDIDAELEGIEGVLVCSRG